MKDLFASKEIDDNVHLCFIPTNKLVFNHPGVVISLGLVEALRTMAMVNKGIIQATTIYRCVVISPLLWSTYDSCFLLGIYALSSKY